MFKIGCHLSASKGYLKMAEDAISIGANTFQFFTRNPRGGRAREVSEEEAFKFNQILKENNFAKLVAHAPYTLNVCSAKEDIRKFAFDMLKDDLKRMEMVPGNLYNFHPGSHTGQGIETGINQIVQALNEIITKDMTTTILLETMAGKGSEVGSRFEEIRSILDGIEIKEKMGVCMDTCHIYDAGYDIVNDLDAVLDEFDKIVGIKNLKAVHVNDSKNPFKSHKDRHEKIGKGFIGMEAITRVINHELLKDLPFILETPNELEGYGEEIKILKEARK